MNFKYRKKPIIVEAFQLTDKNKQDITTWPEWLQNAWDKDPNEVGSLYCVTTGLQIETLEGPLFVSMEDFIIQGVHGEIYPCKPDIFTATYEKVE